MNIFGKIISLLDQHTIEYTIKEHEPTPTSADSAKARGESMNIGAKALIVKVKRGFLLCVIPANRKLDVTKVKELYGKKLRFATKEELLELTGLVPGSVPPFGEILGVEMIIDPSQFDEEKIAFNAGSLTKSIVMKSSDFRRIVRAREEVIT